MRLQLDTTLSGAAGTSHTSQTAGAGPAGSSIRQSQGGSQDSVSISDVSSVVASNAAGRATRVEQICAAIRNGTYQVPSAAISRSIVAHAAS